MLDKLTKFSADNEVFDFLYVVPSAHRKFKSQTRNASSASNVKLRAGMGQAVSVTYLANWCKF